MLLVTDLMPRTPWYVPDQDGLPLDDRPGNYEIIEAHPLSPLEEDKVRSAWWGRRFGQQGFWLHEVNPERRLSKWRLAVSVLRWRGRCRIDRVRLITPRIARVSLIVTPRVKLEV